MEELLMRKTKAVAVLTAAVLVAGAFAGCGKKQAKDDVTEITMWSGDTHSKAVMSELVNEFNQTIGKQNKVKFVYQIKEDAGNQLKVALQNGSEPDLFGAGTLSEFAENNYIVPLDDIEEIKETVAKNSDFQAVGSNVWDGKLYILPISSRVYGLAYNKDLFKAAGIVDDKGEAKPPETIDEMVKDAKILTDKAKQQYGIILPLKWSAWYECEVAAVSRGITGLVNGVYRVQDGKYDFNGIRPLAQAYLDMKKNGSVYPGAEGIDNDPARARFAEGNIGMKFCATWDVGVWNDQFKAKCDWGIVPAPNVSKDEKYACLKEPSWTCAIGKNGLEKKGADKIALVYNWLYSDEVQKTLCEKGVQMPWRADIIEKCNFKDAKKGWADFAKIVTLCDGWRGAMPRDISAYDNDGADFVNRVWSGKVTLDKWIEERTKISNEGIELYKKNNPQKDFSDRVDPTYDNRLK